MNLIGLYLSFRGELDTMAFPLIEADMIEIYDKGELVGFLMVENGYIDGIYVEPSHRRKGLARQAVMCYVDDYGLPDRLHIINVNETAKKFWYSIFDMRILDVNGVDTLYEIVGLKEWEDDLK